METVLHVRLLGGLGLTFGNSSLGTVHSPRLQSLLAYLVLHTDTPQPRQHLAFLFFPDSSEAQARTNLRNLLHLLHQALPEPERFLCGDAQTVQWRPDAPYTFDVTCFEQAVRAAATTDEWQAAVELYRGDLLPGCYDDWILPERERLRQQYINALEQLAAACEQSQNFTAARQAAQRLLNTDPLREETYRRLMRLAALNGDRGGVTHYYNQCRDVLQRELAVEPGADTTAEYQQLLASLTQPRSPAASAPVTNRRDNLPLPLTRLVGREADVHQVQALVKTHRLVTLVGAGGVGKTRLGLAVAHALRADFPDGVRFIDFAPLSDSALIPQALAAVLGVRELPGTPLLETVIHTLRGKRTLLVLDNCEHLVGALSAFAENLVQNVDELHLLATSRETLRLDGEIVWRVASLPVPWNGANDTPDETSFAALLTCPSIELFADQATAVLPTFTLTRSNAPTIARICRRVDGIPLALELAAPWVKLLTVEQIAEHLEASFRLLTNGSRTVLARHQTMRGTLDWSYQLLSLPEQRLLQRLSVFAGGFTLDAAEQVGGTGDIPPGEVLTLLSSLQDKSLVEVEQSDTLRYRLLETVRHYAREKLEEAGAAEHVAKEHFRYTLKLAQASSSGANVDDPIKWLNELEREHANLRAALEWSCAVTDYDALRLELAAALVEFWTRHSYLSEAQYWLTFCLARCPEPNVTRARALSGLGTVHYMRGNPQSAMDCHSAALELYRRWNDTNGIVFSLSNIGAQLYLQSEYARAEPYFAQSLELAEVTHNNAGMLRALNGMGVCEMNLGDLARARELFRQALKHTGQGLDERETIYVRMNLGEVERVAGNLDASADWYRAATDLARALGDKWGVAGALKSLATVRRAQGLVQEAEALCKASMRMSVEMGSLVQVLNSIEGLAAVAAEQGNYPRAARLLGIIESWRNSLQITVEEVDKADHDNCAAAARASLGDAAFEVEMESMRSISRPEAIAYPLSTD